jgi:DNA-binding protein H-NS
MADKAAALDFDRMTVGELTGLIDAAEAKRREKLEDARKALIAEFRQKASKIGFSSLESLLGSPSHDRKGKPSATLPVKFRNPETGETWSGRGRLPKWVENAEKAGRKRDEFAVKT